MLPDFFQQPRLQLANALPRDVIPFAYLAQGYRLVGEQAIMQNIQLFFVQLGQYGLELVAHKTGDFILGKAVFNAGAKGGQKVHARCAARIFAYRHV